MQTLSLAEIQSLAFLPQQPNSTVLVQNVGGLDYRHPSVYACEGPAATASNHSQQAVRYLSHGGQPADWNYWNGPAANVNFFPQNLLSPVIQGNANAIVQLEHQLPSGTPVARNGSVSYAPPAWNVQNAHYAVQQAPARAGYVAASDVTGHSNRANAWVQGSALNQKDYVSQEADYFSRLHVVPQPPVSQAHGNWRPDQSQVEMLLCTEMGIPPPVQFSHHGTPERPAPRLAVNSNYVQRNTKARRKATSSDQKLGNGASVSRLVPSSVQCSPSWVQANRNGGLQETVGRGRVPAVSLPNSTVPARPSARPRLQEMRPIDPGGVNQNTPNLWSDKCLESILRNLLESSESFVNQRIVHGGGTADKAQESLVETLLEPSVKASNATRQQPHRNLSSLDAAGPSCLSQQPPLPQIPQGVVERCSPQGAANQISNLSIPTPHSRSRNGHADESGRLARAVRMVNHAPNQPQPHVSGTEYDPSTIPYYSHEPSVRTLNPLIQAKQLRERLCHGQIAGNSTPHSERRRLSVTAPVVRPGSAPTTVNAVLMSSRPANHASALHDRSQISSASKSVKVDFGTASEGVCGNEGQQNHSAPLLAAVAQSQESVFKPPKVSNQQNHFSACSSQKAVAVVPPLSPQSSNHVDQDGGITNPNNDLPFKIPSTMSLTREGVDLFDFKKANVVPVSSKADVRTNEKVAQIMGSGVPSVGGLSAMSTGSTVLCQEKASKMSGSTGLAMPPAPGASVIKEINEHTSNKQKLYPLPQDILRPLPAKDVPGLAVQCQVLSTTYVHKKDDRDIDSEKVAFDLSSVAVNEWTSAALGNLIALCEKSSEPVRQEMDIEKTARLYGCQEYHNIPDIFGSDLYRSIMDKVRGVCVEDENAVILSEINHACLQKVMANCHILKHEPISPQEPTVKPLVLNTTAHCRRSPRVKQLIVREQLEGARQNGAEKEKMDIIADTKQEGNAPLLDTSSRVERAESTVKRGAMDIFSSIKINVLPPEEARWLFHGEQSDAEKEEEPQSQSPAREGARKEESRVEEECTETQVNVYCCPFCHIGATIDFKARFCTCQPEAEPGGATEKKARGDPSVSRQEEEESAGRSSAMEPNAALVHIPETSKEDLPVGKEAVDKCAESKLVVDTTRNASDSTKQEDSGLCAEQEDGRVDPPESSSVENLADIDPLGLSVVSPASDASGAESDHADSKELNAAVVVLERLLRESVSKGEPQHPPQVHAEEIPATKSKAESFVTPGRTDAISEISTASPLTEPLDLCNLEWKIGSMTSLSLRQRVHRRLSLTEMHSHTQGDVRAREGKRRSERWQKSSCSKSPDRDRSPQNPPQSKGNKRRKDRLSSLLISETKASALDHHNGEKSLPVKRKANNCFPALKSKIHKLGEDECLRLSQGSKTEHGHTLNQGTSSRKLPELKKEVKRVCFMLYGSSKNGNGTTNSNRKLGRKTPLPPAALHLSVNCKEANLLRQSIKSPAKHQVFDSWEHSFIPLKSHHRSKARASKQSNAKRLKTQKCGTHKKARAPVVSPISCGSRSKPSRGRTNPPASAQSTAGLKACTTHLGKTSGNKCSDSKVGTTRLNKTKEKKHSAPKAVLHPNKNQEKGNSAPKAILHPNKNQEKKLSAPKAVLHPNKNQEKGNSATKAVLHPNKNQEKGNAAPKAGTKHLNESEEKKNAAAESEENKFVSKCFQSQAKDSPSISRETKQQELEKAPFPIEGAETVPGKQKQGKTKKVKKGELGHRMKSLLPASGLSKARAKSAAGVGDAHQTAVKEKDSAPGFRMQSQSPPFTGASSCTETKKSASHGKGSCSEKNRYKKKVT